MKTHLISLLATTSCLHGPVYGQASPGHPVAQPYGMSANDYQRPYDYSPRDGDGNRIIINGQSVSLQSPRSSGQQSLLTPPGRQLAGARLPAPGSTVMSIGNSVNIQGSVNSTIVINQMNSGNQSAGLHVEGASNDPDRHD